MPGGTELPFGNAKNMFVLTPTITYTPTTVAGTTGSELTCTVNGVQVGDLVYMNKPTFQSYIGLNNVRVSANNVIAVTFDNNSSATQTPTASEVYTVLVIRPSIAPTQPTAIE